MEDDFALRYVGIYPGVNSRVESVTLAPCKRRVDNISRIISALYPLAPKAVIQAVR